MGKKPAAKAQEVAKKIEESKEKVVRTESSEPTHKAHHASTKPREDQCCSVKKCKRTYKAKGYCVFHYSEWRQGKFGMARYKSCGQNDCKKAMARNRFGNCEDHYQAIYVKGTGVSKAEAPEKEVKKESAA